MHAASLFWFLSSSSPVTWRSSRTKRDEGDEEQPASPGQTQGQLYLRLHCIKPIIHHQGLFSATVNVLFTRFKNVANGVSSTAQRKRINKKKTAVRRFNSEKPLSRALHRVKKPIAKSLQLAEYAFIFWPKSPWTIKLSLNLNKTITPNQSEFISSKMIYIGSITW